MGIVEKDVESLRAEISSLRDELSAVSGRMKDVASSVGAQAYEQAHTVAEKARVEAHKAADKVSHSIEERPFTSVMAAFFFGLLLGVLFGRQR